MSIPSGETSNIDASDINKTFVTKEIGSDNLDGKKYFKIKNPDNEHDKHMIIQSQNAGLASHGNPYYSMNPFYPGLNNNPLMFYPFQQYPNFAALLESYILALKRKDIPKGRTNGIMNNGDENESFQKIINDTNKISDI